MNAIQQFIDESEKLAKKLAEAEKQRREQIMLNKLRDQFAGQALAGLIGNSEYEKLRQELDGKVSEKLQHKLAAEYCYGLANAMLDERAKRIEQEAKP